MSWRGLAWLREISIGVQHGGLLFTVQKPGLVCPLKGAFPAGRAIALRAHLRSGAATGLGEHQLAGQSSPGTGR